MAKVPKAPPKKLRKIISFQISMVNGSVYALCDDGSMFVRTGTLGTHDQDWKQLNDQAINPKPKEEESDDDRTIIAP